MNVAIITSNHHAITSEVKKGTEIFTLMLCQALAEQAPGKGITPMLFASGDSNVTIPLYSIFPQATILNDSVNRHGKHIIFELALLSDAFSRFANIDVYHVNIGDGDIALPFAPFVPRPIIITIHNTVEAEYIREYFALFSQLKNVFFISASEAQRSLLPELPYLRTIHHGIEEDVFSFSPEGGEGMIWAGRAIPEKGMTTAIDVALAMRKPLALFAITKKEHDQWLQTEIRPRLDATPSLLTYFTNTQRQALVTHYQQSKVCLFPVTCEEIFGLVLAEAMSCGTPVVAYARGAIAEVIEDGVTGFIVNPSESDHRGNWIVKQSGKRGMIEAVERIYALPRSRYQHMRRACRTRVEEHFTVDHMAHEYIQAYHEAERRFRGD